MFFKQVGDANRASISPQSGNSYAKTLQVGAENTVKLEQGADGRHYARAVQDGSGNRLAWDQIGNGLADTFVVDGGNSTMDVTQSSIAAQFAPPASGPGG